MAEDALREIFKCLIELKEEMTLKVYLGNKMFDKQLLSTLESLES